MTTLTLQVTEVRFDFDDLDFTLEEQQAVLDDVLGNTYQVEVDNENDDGEVADALVEEVTDATGWCVVSLNYRQVSN
jgi:acetyl esterase/lipase